jgi:hypothetical protein
MQFCSRFCSKSAWLAGISTPSEKRASMWHHHFRRDQHARCDYIRGQFGHGSRLYAEAVPHLTADILHLGLR